MPWFPGFLTEAAELSIEIESLQALVNQLAKKRDRLHGDFIDPHLTLISPARRLPTMWWRKYLQHPFHLTETRSSARQMLHSYFHTCASRGLSTPGLWASLHIVLPEERKSQQIREAVDIWLSGSGVLPLSIFLVSAVADPDPRIFETLIFTPRAGSDFESNFLRAIPPHRYHSSRRHMGNSQAPLPWGLLRHLYLGIGAELTPAEGPDLLRRCPNLEICALYFPPILRHPDFPQPPLMGCCMEHLQQFSVVDDRVHTPTDPHKVIHFFNDLDLPHLPLKYVAKAVNEFPLASLLTSVAAHLRSLSLRAPQIPGRAIFDVLHRVPSLAELVICSKEPFDDQFWNHMIQGRFFREAAQ
ncbi:hypothetical protein DFH08DRAFT_811953 [Mycena albidolilacea]|uniref:Uncharacterized protein n=1 Tax=Mycena albidolilacea TaxID=1033008 RepID=A0AAD7EMQ5_9AGAR|nr:hypothetical protein DFH08DRAFT_811953 [Mycena albidolilacea]